MSIPTNIPPFFAPYTESGGDVEYWQRFPMDLRSENFLRIETTTSFKKPKISETIVSSEMSESNNEVMTDTSFKTQVCMKFRSGNCLNGNMCNFAHVIGDIRRSLYHGQELNCKELYVAGLWNRGHRLYSKMKLCRFFSRREKCPYGERCNFLHEGLEKRREGSGRFRESSSISIGCSGSARGNRNVSGHLEFKRFGDSNLNANQINPNTGFWRPRLCHKWQMSGNCAYGDKCIFAHGQAGILQCLTTSTKKDDRQSNNLMFEHACELRKHVVQPQGGKEHVASRSPPCAKADASTLKTTAYDQPLQKKCSFKWIKQGKINGIYADWIDDMTPLGGSFE